MKKVRTGNDIYIIWNITKNDNQTPNNDGQFDLTGADVLLIDAFNNPVPFNFEINAIDSATTQISGVYWGKDQKTKGKYRLLLVKNAGQENMITLDYADAFILTDIARFGIIDGTPESTVTVATVQLESTFNTYTGILDTYTKDEIDALLAQKQNLLDFDNTPTSGSANPVTSDGIFNALEDKANTSGEYSGLTVGNSSTADNLNGYVEQNANLTVRTAGGIEDIESGFAKIVSIKGQSLFYFNMFNPAQFVLSEIGAENYDMTFDDYGFLNFDNLYEETIQSGDTIAEMTLCDEMGGHKIFVFPNIIYLVNREGLDFEEFKFYCDGKEIADEGAFITITSSKPNLTLKFVANYPAQGSIIALPVVIDATRMFGQGNEPQDVETMLNYLHNESMVTMPQVPNLSSFKATDFKTVGFNQLNITAQTYNPYYEVGFWWDDDVNAYFCVMGTSASKSTWTTDDIVFLPNMQYELIMKNARMTAGTGYVKLYYTDGSDERSEDITTTAQTISIVTAPNKTIRYIQWRATSGNRNMLFDDYTLHFVWSGSKNGQIQAYWEDDVPLNITTATGKLLDAEGNPTGESVVVAPNGLNSVWNAEKQQNICDEIYSENGKTYLIKRVDVKTFGELPKWTKIGSYMYAQYLTDIDQESPAIQCGIFTSQPQSLSFVFWPNEICARGQLVEFHTPSSAATDNTIYTTATTAEELKEILSGYSFTYNLQTPLIYELDNNILPITYKVDDFGTEGITPNPASVESDIVDLSSFILNSGTTASGQFIFRYELNAPDLLRRLPQLYISSGSMENFLQALGAAMGGNWSINYNAAKKKFEFEYTANT